MNRNIDPTGRISIPKEMRKQLKLNEGDPVNIELKNNKIIITGVNDPFEKYLNELFVNSFDENTKKILKNILLKYTELKK